LRKKIYQQKGLAVLSNQLKYAGTSLSDDKSLADYDLAGSSVITIDLGTPTPANLTKQIVLKVSNKEYHPYTYDHVRAWTIRQMIEIAVNSSKSYFSVVYGSKVLRSDTKISDLDLEMQKQPTVTLVLVRVEKLRFYKELSPAPTLASSEIKLESDKDCIE